MEKVIGNLNHNQICRKKRDQEKRTQSKKASEIIEYECSIGVLNFETKKVTKEKHMLSILNSARTKLCYS